MVSDFRRGDEMAAELSDMRFAHTEGACDLVFAPDGRVVTCGADGEVSQCTCNYNNLTWAFDLPIYIPT